MDFNNFHMSRNGNECPLQVSYLRIYFTCNVNTTLVSRSWQCWAATASAACVEAWSSHWLMTQLTNG